MQSRGIFLFLSVHFPGIVCRFISFLSGRYYRPLSSFFCFFVCARGVGGLPLRHPFSTTGRVRPRVRHVVYCPECHSGLSAAPPRPLRPQCGCSSTACDVCYLRGIVSRMLFLALSISGGWNPRFRPFPAILFGLCLLSSNTIRYFSSKKSLLFAYIKNSSYLCAGFDNNR